MEVATLWGGFQFKYSAISKWSTERNYQLHTLTRSDYLAI